MSCTTSNRVRSSQSPVQAFDRTCCSSVSHGEEDLTKGWQEEYSSVDFVELVSWFCKLCFLPPAPADGKVCGFCTGQDLGNQPSSSYYLPHE